jgi:hypothetical protein
MALPPLAVQVPVTAEDLSKLTTPADVTYTSTMPLPAPDVSVAVMGAAMGTGFTYVCTMQGVVEEDKAPTVITVAVAVTWQSVNCARDGRLNKSARTNVLRNIKLPFHLVACVAYYALRPNGRGLFCSAKHASFRQREKGCNRQGFPTRS